jgi:hypothetical protein
VLSRLAALTALVVVAQGCAGEAALDVAPRAEVCGPRIEGEPCTSARVGVEYPVAVWSHCGVGPVYFAGRYWVVEPTQPEGSNTLQGVMQLVEEDELVAFRTEEGRQYAFKPAPTSFTPPICS